MFDLSSGTNSSCASQINGSKTYVSVYDFPSLCLLYEFLRTNIIKSLSINYEKTKAKRHKTNEFDLLTRNIFLSRYQIHYRNVQVQNTGILVK